MCSLLPSTWLYSDCASLLTPLCHPVFSAQHVIYQSYYLGLFLYQNILEAYVLSFCSAHSAKGHEGFLFSTSAAGTWLASMIPVQKFRLLPAGDSGSVALRAFYGKYMKKCLFVFIDCRELLLPLAVRKPVQLQ